MFHRIYQNNCKVFSLLHRVMTILRTEDSEQVAVVLEYESDPELFGDSWTFKQICVESPPRPSEQHRRDAAWSASAKL